MRRPRPAVRVVRAHCELLAIWPARRRCLSVGDYITILQGRDGTTDVNGLNMNWGAIQCTPQNPPENPPEKPFKKLQEKIQEKFDFKFLEYFVVTF